MNKNIENEQETENIVFQIHIKDIQWEADNMDDVSDLETTLILPNKNEYYNINKSEIKNYDDELISDMISDNVGFTHEGFEYNFVYKKDNL